MRGRRRYVVIAVEVVRRGGLGRVDPALVRERDAPIGEVDRTVLDRRLDRDESGPGGVAVVAVAGARVERRAVARTDDLAVADRRPAADVQALGLVRTAIDPAFDAVLAGHQDHFVEFAVGIADGEQPRALLVDSVDRRQTRPVGHARPFRSITYNVRDSDRTARSSRDAEHGRSNGVASDRSRGGRKRHR